MNSNIMYQQSDNIDEEKSKWLPILSDNQWLFIKKKTSTWKFIDSPNNYINKSDFPFKIISGIKSTNVRDYSTKTFACFVT